MFGVRNDLNIEPCHPKPLSYQYTVRDALPSVVRQADNGGFGKGAMRPTDRPSPTIGASPQTGNGKFPASLIEAETGNGGKVVRVIHDTSGLWSSGDVTDKPCPTITVGVNSVNSCHLEVEAETDISRYAIGAEWDKMGKPGTQSDKYSQLVGPSLTSQI